VVFFFISLSNKNNSFVFFSKNIILQIQGKKNKVIMDTSMILVMVLFLLLVITILYFSNRLSNQKAEIKTLERKCLRFSDAKVQGIVEEMPQLQMLLSSASDAKNSLNEAHNKIKSMLSENDGMKKEIARVNLELKTMLDNIHTSTTRKIEMLGDAFKQHDQVQQYLLLQQQQQQPQPSQQHYNIQPPALTPFSYPSSSPPQPGQQLHMMSKVFNERIPLHTKECPLPPVALDFVQDVIVANKELEKTLLDTSTTTTTTTTTTTPPTK
jgi:hypothetical protein